MNFAQATLTHPPVRRRDPDVPRLASIANAPATDGDITLLPSARGYDAMLAAFRVTGGIARGDDLARLLEYLQRGDFVALARRLVSREVCGFEWHESFWVPMFQFELRDLSIKPGPQRVLAELAAELDGWNRAAWFARPNTWLDEQRPVDLLDSDLAAVLEAARTDRFVALG